MKDDILEALREFERECERRFNEEEAQAEAHHKEVVEALDALIAKFQELNTKVDGPLDQVDSF